MAEINVLPLGGATVDALQGVGTPTWSTVLLKRGLRSVWMGGARPLQHRPARQVGRAFTLRFVPAREDLATPASWGAPISTRAAIEAMPAGVIAVVGALGVADAGIFGDILCERMQRLQVRALVTFSRLPFRWHFEAPGLRTRRHDFQHQAAAIGQVVTLVLRLRVVDRRGLQDVVDVSHWGRQSGPRPPRWPQTWPCPVATSRNGQGCQKTKTPVEPTIWGFCRDHPGRPKTPRDPVTCARSSPARSPSTRPGSRLPSGARSHR